MAASNFPMPAPASVGCRLCVSLVLVLHFFAILTAVTAVSSPGFPAPALALAANRPLQPYLQLTALTSSYRFFAPNPGAPNLLWFRVQYEDRVVRWVEFPRRQDFRLRMPYLRHLTLALVQNGQVTAADNAPGWQLSQLGQICVASFIRHVAKTQTRTGSDGMPVPVRNVGVYDAVHAFMSPGQVRAGWTRTDLRTYKAIFLGAYGPDGDRTDEFRPGLVEHPISQVAASILAVDFYPLVRRCPGADSLRLAADLGLPEPIRGLLDRFPELRESGAAAGDLQGRIEELLTGPPGPDTGGPGGPSSRPADGRGPVASGPGGVI